MARQKSSTRTQGLPFHQLEIYGFLTDHGIQISMDRTGCWRDNVFGRMALEERQIRRGVSVCL
jgi:hypothetical protein